MFNNYSVSPSQSIAVNAVAGTLIKTYKDSFFVYYHVSCNDQPGIFDNKDPHILRKGVFRDEYTKHSVVVLQTMLCGDKEILAEVILKEDFDKLFKEVEE